MSQAYWLPAHLACATCGYVMEQIGRFEGGKVVVKCSGYACPEYGIERKYVGTPVDLAELEDGDMDAPLERESADIAASLAVIPVETPSDPVPVDPAPPAEVPDAVV